MRGAGWLETWVQHYWIDLQFQDVNREVYAASKKPPSQFGWRQESIQHGLGMKVYGGSWDIILTRTLSKSSRAFIKNHPVIYINKMEGIFFTTSGGVRQGRILFPTLFNILLEKVMKKAPEDFTPQINWGISGLLSTIYRWHRPYRWHWNRTSSSLV